MDIPHITDLRPRTVWDIVDDAFDMYREKFTLFAGISAVTYVPGYLLYIACMSGATGQLATMSKSADPTSALGPFFWSLLLTSPLLGIAFVLQNGATTIAVDDILRGNQDTNIKSVYARMFRHVFPLLGASLMAALLAACGICLFYIGALLVLGYFAFIAQAVVLENKGAFAASRRTRELTSRHFDKSFGMLILLGVLSLILSGGLSALVSGVAELIPRHGDLATAQTQRMVIEQAIAAVVQVLIAPISSIATTLLYYDLRVRREGLDLAEQARRIGFPIVDDPFGGVLDPKIRR